MSSPDDSQSIFAPVATTYGVPVLVAAFLFQPTISVLGESERGMLWVISMATLAGLAVTFAMNPRWWVKAIMTFIILIAFSAGWGQTVKEVGASERANDRRCLALQRDMLSARPRRADGPNLFQALGCRPQGEGSVYASQRSAASSD